MQRAVLCFAMFMGVLIVANANGCVKPDKKVSASPFDPIPKEDCAKRNGEVEQFCCRLDQEENDAKSYRLLFNLSQQLAMCSGEERQETDNRKLTLCYNKKMLNTYFKFASLVHLPAGETEVLPGSFPVK